MGIFDEVMANAKNVAANVGKKAEKIVDISKLKFSAMELESDISKKYQTLGKVVYSATKDKSLADGIDTIIEEIDELYAQLEDINEQINSLRNKKACPNCKKINDAEAVYCSVCGTLLIEKEDECCEEKPEDSSEEKTEACSEEKTEVCSEEAKEEKIEE